MKTAQYVGGIIDTEMVSSTDHGAVDDMNVHVGPSWAMYTAALCTKKGVFRDTAEVSVSPGC